MTLSQERAKAVYDKLIQFGVPASKLKYKGFGFNHLLNREHTKEADTEK
jgi:outer membrane protein OmpA-like peptidoglycan-associated protein